jgi:hypothetical protein
MFEKLIRAILGETNKPAAGMRIHESGQLALLSTRELDLRRMYERMAQHQRLIEVEEDLHNRF